MELKIERRYKCKDYTIGTLYVDGKRFCDTLEDTVRDIKDDGSGKIYGKTAIPSGRYEVKLTVSPKFKRLLPILVNVPFFEGVRIHSGNTEFDTEGCPLVGENKIKGKVINSRMWENRLMEVLKSTIEDIYITIE